MSASPSFKLWQAKCNPTNEDEQALSMPMLGPFKLKNHEMRFDSIDMLELAKYRLRRVSLTTLGSISRPKSCGSPDNLELTESRPRLQCA